MLVPIRSRSPIPGSSRSTVPNSDDFLIVISSESPIALSSERRFSSARNDNFHGSESAHGAIHSLRARHYYSELRSGNYGRLAHRQLGDQRDGGAQYRSGRGSWGA